MELPSGKTKTIAHEPAGKIDSNERDALIKASDKQIKFYKYSFTLCCVTFFFLITLVMAPALYKSMRKEQKRRKQLLKEELPIYLVRGELTWKASNKGIATLYVGDFMLPEIVSSYDSEVKQFLGQTVSAEYIPSISKNRCYYNVQGNGYNFILKKPITRTTLHGTKD